MPNYNKNSVFAVSSAGTMPNRVDDLIFFEDISHDQKQNWNEFEHLMQIGDYNAANSYAKACGEVHGYFSDLYNMMVNRIKSVQQFLVLNETNINNGTGTFASFKKPDIFVYQEEVDDPRNILKDQVWIGPKEYFDKDLVVTESLNKLRPANDIASGPQTIWGLTIRYTQEGYFVVNGTCDTSVSNNVMIEVGSTSGERINNGTIWSWWNYYIGGTITNYKAGFFNFQYMDHNANIKDVGFGMGSTANMHANFLDLPSDSTQIKLMIKPIYGETYNNVTFGFMICKTAETTPNQKFVKYEGP